MARSTHTGTVRTNQPRSMLMYNQHSACHINNRYTFSDTDDEADASAGCFHNCIGGACRRYENTRGFGIGSSFCFGNGIKDWDTFYGGVTLARGHATNDICSCSLHIASVILSFPPSYALYNYPRRTI